MVLRDEESGQPVPFSLTALSALPAERREVSYETGHGFVHHEAEGPRL